MEPVDLMPFEFLTAKVRDRARGRGCIATAEVQVQAVAAFGRVVDVLDRERGACAVLPLKPYEPGHSLTFSHLEQRLPEVRDALDISRVDHDGSHLQGGHRYLLADRHTAGWSRAPATIQLVNPWLSHRIGLTS